MKQPAETRPDAALPPKELSLPEEVYSVPEGDWIVLSPDVRRVVAHHPDLGIAEAEAESKGEKNGIVMKAHNLRAHWVI